MSNQQNELQALTPLAILSKNIKHTEKTKVFLNLTICKYTKLPKVMDEKKYNPIDTIDCKITMCEEANIFLDFA